MGLLPAAAGAHVPATGLAVVAVNDREIDYRLTVVPSELPEPASQLLSRAMAGPVRMPSNSPRRCTGWL